MSLIHTLVLFVAVQRAAELLFSRRNERRLKEQGAVEVDAASFPLFIVVHAGWLVALAVFVPGNAPVYLPLLVLFFLLQALRVWVIASLGRYWTTRVITLPGAPLIRKGPYHFLRHPNYLVVANEIAVLPLAFGAWEIALVFSVLNGALLLHRIRIEDQALASRRTVGAVRADPHRPA